MTHKKTLKSRFKKKLRKIKAYLGKELIFIPPRWTKRVRKKIMRLNKTNSIATYQQKAPIVLNNQWILNLRGKQGEDISN